jgi:hypothetical protein
LDCPELIEDFEAKLAENQSPKRKPESDGAQKKKKIDKIEVNCLKPIQILRNGLQEPKINLS